MWGSGGRPAPVHAPRPGRDWGRPVGVRPGLNSGGGEGSAELQGLTGRERQIGSNKQQNKHRPRPGSVPDEETEPGRSRDLPEVPGVPQDNDPRLPAPWALCPGPCSDPRASCRNRVVSLSLEQSFHPGQSLGPRTEPCSHAHLSVPPPVPLLRPPSLWGHTPPHVDAQHSPCADSSLVPVASWSRPPGLLSVAMHIMPSEQPLAVVPSPRPPPLWGPFQEPGYRAPPGTRARRTRRPGLLLAACLHATAADTDGQVHSLPSGAQSLGRPPWRPTLSPGEKQGAPQSSAE